MEEELREVICENIDCRDTENLKEAVRSALDKLVTKQINKVSLSSIVPSNLLELLGIDENSITDYNGKQCDYWGKMYHENNRISIYGHAWRGSAELSLYGNEY